MTTPAPFIPWSTAWHQAHVGPAHLGSAHHQGFYRRHSPERHFATEAQAGPLAEALAALIREVDTRLGQPRPLTVVDIGAGAGELLTGILGHLDDELIGRLEATGIDVRPRPDALDPRIEWVQGEAPEVVSTIWRNGVTGLIIAHEWLDDLPVDVVQRDDLGTLREVLVDPATGEELLGAEVSADGDAHDWMQQWWWPVRDRAEVGLHRDRAWARLCTSLNAGTAIAIDYSHLAPERDSGRFDAGTMTGFRDGQAVWPIPDASMNITAHVALDSCAAATDPPGTILDQASAVRDLLGDIDPAIPDASTDPAGFAATIERVSARHGLWERSAGVRWLRFDVS